MHHTEGEKVAGLECNPDWPTIHEKQEAIAAACHLELSMPKNKRAVAGVAILFYPCGEIRTRIVGIEPEHVRPTLTYLDRMRKVLEEFEARARQSNEPAQVVPLPRNRKAGMLKVAAAIWLSLSIFLMTDSMSA